MVQFPGILGIGLYRLRIMLRDTPLLAVGPLLGFIAADLAIDLSRGRLAYVAVDLVIGPLLALMVGHVAQRPHPGISGMLLLVLGLVSVLAASMLLALGLAATSAPVVVMGLRHLAVGSYAWAAIADEPPPRRRLILRPVHL